MKTGITFALITAVMFVSIAVAMVTDDPTHGSSHEYDNGTHGNESDHGNGTGHHEGIHLFSLNLDHVRQPLTITIFLIIVAACKLGFHHANFLSSYVPESCLLIILGTVVGGIMHASGTDRSYYANFSSELFFLYLLPPIILESAYSLHDRVFFDNLGTILLFAVVGTIINCFIIGPLLYGLYIGGAMGEMLVPVTLLQCLVFSALIVAVDPVAVLAIFQEIGVNNVLYFMVFGESLLNDAVTVVIYNTMKTFSRLDTIPIEQILLGIASFFTVSLGGLIIGIIVGAICSFFTRFTQHVRVVEPLAIFSLAYMAYLLAEMFHFSGIISIIGCGLMQAQYAFHNLSHKSNTTVKYFGKMLSATCDSVIFLFLGLSLVSTRHEWHTGFVLWSVILCLLVRFSVVYFLTFLANKIDRLRTIDWEEQFIMAYGGLRGAVSFSLVAMIDPAEIPKQGLFETTTLVIIIFTVFIQGITIKPLVKLLRINRAEKSPVSIYEEINTHVTDHVMAGVEEICGHYGHNFIREKLDHLDNNYIRRVLMRDPTTKDDDILELYHRLTIQMHFENVEGCTILEDFNSDLEIYKPKILERGSMMLDDKSRSMDMMHRTMDAAGYRNRSAYKRSALQGRQISPNYSRSSSLMSTLSVPKRSMSVPDKQQISSNPTSGAQTPNMESAISDDVFVGRTRNQSAPQSTATKPIQRKSTLKRLLSRSQSEAPDEVVVTPTTDDVRKWLTKNPTKDGFHRKYDRNITNEERSDLVYHLHEKKRRTNRRLMSMGYLQSPRSSLCGSPIGSREELYRRPVTTLDVITEGAPLGAHEKADDAAESHRPRDPTNKHGYGSTSGSAETGDKQSPEADTTPLLHRHSPDDSTKDQQLVDVTKRGSSAGDVNKPTLSVKSRGHLSRQDTMEDDSTV